MSEKGRSWGEDYMVLLDEHLELQKGFVSLMDNCYEEADPSGDHWLLYRKIKKEQRDVEDLLESVEELGSMG